MSWFSTMILYFLIFDTLVIILGGFGAAYAIMADIDPWKQKLWDRAIPAVALLIASHFAAAVVLVFANFLLQV